MADVLINDAHSPLAVRWTCDDCANLERADILTERYELVEGDRDLSIVCDILRTEVVH